MQNFWQQLEKEIEKLAPDLLRKFRPGADDHAIAQAEQRLGMSLPEEVKAFFRGHNGSDGACFGYWVFLSLDTVCDIWQSLKERFPSAYFVENNDHLDQWNWSWLPLLRVEPDGPFMFIKLEQADGVMQPGCVFLHSDIEYYPWINYPWIKSRAWNEFLEELVEDVRTEGYAYDAQDHRLRSIACYLALEPIGETPWREGLEEQEESPKRVTYPGLACLSYTRTYIDRAHPALEQSIEQSWDIIQSTMDTLTPKNIHHTGWPEPIAYTFEQIEEAMQMPFPEEMKIWYACCGSPGLIALDWWRWCSLGDLFGTWQQMQEESPDPRQPIPFPLPGTYLANADPRVQFVWWHPRWFPLLYHADGCLYCVDMAPTTQGQEGQIIVLLQRGQPYTQHHLDEEQMPPVVWVAPSLRIFLAILAQDLKEGRYHYDEKSYSLWSQEGLAYVQEDSDLREWTVTFVPDK